MRILGIDTSCDDTSIAFLETKNSRFKILSNIVSSQVKLHAKYGGVYPSLAKREHQKNLPAVFKKAIRRVRGKRSKIDLIGVTVGPGLEPCLWQGVNFARDLAKKLKKPLIPVNHLEAHILVNLIDRGLASVKLPAVCLVVSGGHTILFLMEKIGKYKLIGETRDDAAGECLDKTARILGLGYPGGPAIAKMATRYKTQDTHCSHTAKYKTILPRPMLYQKNYDFSFSGLKTAVLYNYRSQLPKIRTSREYIQEMSFEIQQAIIDVLIHKTLKVAKDYRVESIIFGGGVAANEELRKQFKEKIKKVYNSSASPRIKFYIPDTEYCTDNAVMVGITAYFHRLEKRKKSQPEIKAEANLKI